MFVRNDGKHKGYGKHNGKQAYVNTYEHTYEVISHEDGDVIVFLHAGLEDQLLGKVIQSEKAELEDMKNELQENMVSRHDDMKNKVTRPSRPTMRP